jgi:hypothetical protein
MGVIECHLQVLHQALLALHILPHLLLFGAT